MTIERCPSTGRPCGFGSDCGGLGYCKRTGTHGLTGDAGEVERLRQQLAGAVKAHDEFRAAVIAALDADLISDGAQINRIRETLGLPATRGQ